MLQLPTLVKTGNENDKSLSTANPFSIMQEIAKAAYIEDVIVGKPNSLDRLEVKFIILIVYYNLHYLQILGFIEIA